jgi:hypothetical protein
MMIPASLHARHGCHHAGSSPWAFHACAYCSAAGGMACCQRQLSATSVVLVACCQIAAAAKQGLASAVVHTSGRCRALACVLLLIVYGHSKTSCGRSWGVMGAPNCAVMEEGLLFYNGYGAWWLRALQNCLLRAVVGVYFLTCCREHRWHDFGVCCSGRICIAGGQEKVGRVCCRCIERYVLLEIQRRIGSYGVQLTSWGVQFGYFLLTKDWRARIALLSVAYSQTTFRSAACLCCLPQLVRAAACTCSLLSWGSFGVSFVTTSEAALSWLCTSKGSRHQLLLLAWH